MITEPTQQAGEMHFEFLLRKITYQEQAHVVLQITLDEQNSRPESFKGSWDIAGTKSLIQRSTERLTELYTEFQSKYRPCTQNGEKHYRCEDCLQTYSDVVLCHFVSNLPQGKFAYLCPTCKTKRLNFPPIY